MHGVMGGNTVAMQWQSVDGIPAKHDVASQSVPQSHVTVSFSSAANEPRTFVVAGLVWPQNVSGEGVSVFAQWYDGDGRYIGGAHPRAVSGSTPTLAPIASVSDGDTVSDKCLWGWVPVAETFELPIAAASMTVGVYARPGTTGAALFTNISLSRSRSAG
jgi:hypothetical protein